MDLQVGTEVSTEYYSDYNVSDYISSTEHCTPFPSLTLSKKMELEKYLHNGQVTYNISTFNDSDIIEPEQIVEEQQQQEEVNREIVKYSENNGCCLLL